MKVDGMSLSSVLSDFGVDKVDNVRPNSNAEDNREDDVGSGLFDDRFSCLDVGILDVNDLSMDHG